MLCRGGRVINSPLTSTNTGQAGTKGGVRCATDILLSPESTSGSGGGSSSGSSSTWCEAE